MRQLALPGMETQKLVNIATVKHRSPFRYPGGKTWLVPRVFDWLTQRPEKPSEFIEPFAGGAIVGLSVAFEQLAQHVLLVELDEQVASVWETIITAEDGEWLAKRILDFELTTPNVDALFVKEDVTHKVRALQTIVKNRVNRGGILARGAGRVKQGENGRGIRSRWYPQTLARRIYDIVQIKQRLAFLHDDGLKVIKENIDRPDVVFFIDPPYTVSAKGPGRRLYDYSDVDHTVLFETLSHSSGDFLMTYDNAPEVLELAHTHHFDTLAIPMKNTHHAKLTELLIGKDLDWARQ